jgi:amidase
LKPTFGLVSHFAVGFAAEPSVDHVGPMASTVADVAAALQAVAGYDDNDPRQRRGVPETIDTLTDLDGGVRGLRIGILEEGFADPIEPGVAAGVMAAVSTLEKLGAEVSRISIPQHAQIDSVYAALVLEGARAIHDTGFFGIGAKAYYPASIITAIDRMWREHGDMLPPRTKLNHLVAELSRRNYHGGVYAKAHNVRPAYVAAFDRALAKVDVLAMPTVRNIAPLVEAEPTDPTAAIEANLRRNWMLMPIGYNTKPTNYTGHPALAVPCGKVDGMPISLQLVGNFLADPLLLRVAHAYQKAVDWDVITGVG